MQTKKRSVSTAEAQWADDGGAIPAPPPAEVFTLSAQRLRASVQQHPYATLGLAAMIGLAVGSGLWAALARALVGVGVRLAVASVLESDVLNQSFTNHTPEV